jgi:hypothetical protein
LKKNRIAWQRKKNPPRTELRLNGKKTEENELNTKPQEMQPKQKTKRPQNQKAKKS